MNGPRLEVVVVESIVDAYAVGAELGMTRAEVDAALAHVPSPLERAVEAEVERLLLWGE